MDNIWLFDLEVFTYDWIMVAHSLDTEDELILHNDIPLAQAFLNDVLPVLGGYNAKHYDMHIIRCIYCGAPNEVVKGCNDWIIADDQQGWAFPWFKYRPKLPVPVFDLMDDIPVPLRLKEIEANLGMAVRESSVPFDLDRPLTPEELEEVIAYCQYDVRATKGLWAARQDYLQAKIDLGDMKGISWAEAMSMTNAKLAARFLDAKKQIWDDEFVYEIPDNLRVKNQAVLKFFEEIDYNKKLEIIIANCPHVVAWGGLHGALEKYTEEATETREIASYDVASYYPSLIIQYGYMSRNVPDPREYERVYHDRLQAKRDGDKKKANAYKLVLNTTYGGMKNQYNDLYDPRMANAVCISGQLFLIDLIEKLKIIETVRLIQSNTDGIIISYDRRVGRLVDLTVKLWEKRTRFVMEKTTITKIVQKDVNNYVMSTAKETKVKGGYVSNWEGGTWQNSSLAIVDKAIVHYLLHGIAPEETVNACDHWKQFQMVAKTGRTYDKTVYVFNGEDTEVQSTNRVFATQNEACGTIYKVKVEKKRRDKVANAPEHCWIDNSDDPSPGSLDKQWYIDLANKRIKDYIGGTT